MNKQWFFMLITLLFAPTILPMIEIERGVAAMSIADGDVKQGKQPDGYFAQYQKHMQQWYEDTKALIQAISDADATTVAQKKSASKYFNGLLRPHKAKLTQDFKEPLAFMGDKWPCSPVWVALEWVIKSKQDGESEATYLKRVEILKQVAEEQGDKYCESITLRRGYPSNCWGWVFSCFGGPCISCRLIVGEPIHRAAQANNIEALDFFWKREKSKSSGACVMKVVDGGDVSGPWSPMHYAIRFKADNAAAYLAKEEIGCKNHTTKASCSDNGDCCASLECLASCFGTDVGKQLAADLNM